MGHVAVGRNPRAQLSQEERPDIVAEINLKFGNQIVIALVDTGCSTTCVSENAIQKLPIIQSFKFCPQTDIGFSINGSDVVTLGLLRLEFNIGSTRFITNARVMRGLVRPIVLGWDFLCRNQSIIDLKNSSITINGIITPFLKRDRKPIPPHLIAYQDTVIPPFSRMPVKSTIHAELQHIDSSGTDTVLTQPIPDHSPVQGVITGHSLASVKHGITHCELLNTLSVPVLIPTGALLANFNFTNERKANEFCFYANVDELTEQITTSSPECSPQTTPKVKLPQNSSPSRDKHSPMPTTPPTPNSPTPSSPTPSIPSPAAGLDRPLVLDLSKAEIPEGEDPKELDDLLRVKHNKAFSWTKNDMGKTTLIKHYSRIKPGPPIVSPQYRCTPQMAEIIEEQVNLMWREGICEPSDSPYNHPILLIPKKHGGYRFVIDLRKLNSQSEKFHYPMPHISDALHKVKGKFFSQMR